MHGRLHPIFFLSEYSINTACEKSCWNGWDGDAEMRFPSEQVQANSCVCLRRLRTRGPSYLWSGVSVCLWGGVGVWGGEEAASDLLI